MAGVDNTDDTSPHPQPSRQDKATGHGAELNPIAELERTNARLQEEIEAYRRREVQQSASEQRYRTLVETPNLGVMLIDPEGRYIYTSPKIKELTGYVPQDFQTNWKMGFKLAHPDDRRKGMEIFRQTLEGTAIADQEFRFLHKNGEVVWASGSTFPICDANGRVTAVQVIIQDISARKQAEENLSQVEDQLHLAQKMEAIGQLTAGIAHNFNNMLMQIMGNVELAMMDSADEVRETLQISLKGCVRAAHMIDQLMIYSRKGEVEKKPVDINAVVEDTVAICRKTFDRKIEIALPPPPAQPAFVHGDAGQLEQVLLNLCINARDALESVQEPRLRLGVSDSICRRPPHAEETPATPSPHVRISVFDNGVGIDAKTRQQIFDPFFTTKDVDKGTGLGLSTAYAIAQQHDGWIEVESNPGSGTTFNIFLPITQDETSSEMEDDATDVAGGTETVLVVDDEEGIRNVVSTMLKKKGYAVIEAEDGRSGLDLFHQRRAEIALVLLDLSMPKVSGEDVLAAILTTDPQTRVVIFTGQEIDKIALEGSRAFLRKPIIQHELLQTVRRVLDE